MPWLRLTANSGPRAWRSCHGAYVGSRTKLSDGAWTHAWNWESPRDLDGFRPAFPGTDANAFVHRQHKDLAVSNFALLTRSAAANDGVDGGLHELLVDGDLKLDLPGQIHRELPTAIEFRLALLSPKPLAVHDGQAKHLYLGEGRFDFFQLAGLDYGNHEFHVGMLVPLAIMGKCVRGQMLAGCMTSGGVKEKFSL